MDDLLAVECANCGAPLSGPYCARCGQHATPLRPTIHDLMHEAVHEFAHVDGKILTTLRLLVTAPGRLTREFIDGHRARYIGPIRLYLVCCLLFFAVVAVLPSRKMHVTVNNPSYTRLQRGVARVNADPTLLAESFKHNIPRTAFVLMPLMGALVFAFYRRTEPTYVPHLYFAVHYHAFVFLLMIAVALLTAISSPWTAIPGVLLFFGTLPYLAYALRAVYGGSRVMTWTKTIVIWAAHGFLVLGTVTGIMLFTLYEAAA